MKRELIRNVLASDAERSGVEVAGWVRTRRDAKGFSFLEINDGSCLGSLQVVADEGIPGWEDLKRLTTGASLTLVGDLVTSPAKGQQWEMRATALKLLGEAPEDYPLQKKRHSAEFMREIAHLRPRANLYGAIFRVRSRLTQAVHRFFAERDFVNVHTPIITASDCEGAGEMFRVTTHDPLAGGGKPEEDFFEKAAYLTVSGQLEGETFACALSNIYTFGPTFRAENSHTSRHAAEFWMIEPEVAFCDLAGDMDLAEEFVREMVREVVEGMPEDFALFAKFVDKGLAGRLQQVLNKPFVRVSYTEAVEILQKSGEKFSYPVAWGENLQSEHERYLTEKHFQAPVTVYNYPSRIKPFYMRQNDDGETVAAMDLLVPGIGELIGGSQREERYERLKAAMDEEGLSEGYNWYLDLRKYGSVPHAGFGLGFERLVMFVTGVGNIRDVIPFPRTPGNCEF
ncbi:asparagine--tRNA ligase [Roseibacillus ishigakijimensis]|uniref:Asparagine--tRNA ligase n=1 Tax=Roseibacillus ishigakijimensis TaxID=454146 RepID=A0A934RL08_9BACT|nr:asparagine--tRNA ligase [Roseibacillus ishigakijimensis]MBK1832690.1 asparagine--tRNA ligase [Roseibacillus ishigakijimensis]